MNRARNLISMVCVAAAFGCSSTSPVVKPSPSSSRETPQMLSTVKPDDLECARPGGKLPGDVKVQLVEVAGGFVDPIHIASPKDGTGRLFVCERPGVI